MTEQDKNKLAKLNGFEEDRYTDKVKENIKQTQYDKDKEHAITRKLAKAVLDHLVYGVTMPQDIVEEFLKYYDDMESIKAEAKRVTQSN